MTESVPALKARLALARAALAEPIEEQVSAGAPPGTPLPAASTAEDRPGPGESRDAAPAVAAAATAEAPGADDSPAVSVARSFAVAMVEAPIERDVVNLRAAKLMLADEGYRVGLSDDRTPVLEKGGIETPISADSLEAILGPDLMKARGKAGSGLDEGSRRAGILPDEFDEALKSQSAFQRMGQRRFLEEYARRRGK